MSRGSDVTPFIPLWVFIIFFMLLPSRKPKPEPPPATPAVIDSTLKVEAE